MDSREKIVTVEQAASLAERGRAAGTRLRAITGHFDPLLASHARRLAELARPDGLLFALIADPPDPLLPARARAELVAALRAVDYVILPGSAAIEAALDRLRADEVFREEPADRDRTSALIRHVHTRHQTR